MTLMLLIYHLLWGGCHIIDAGGRINCNTESNHIMSEGLLVTRARVQRGELRL